MSILATIIIPVVIVLLGFSGVYLYYKRVKAEEAEIIADMEELITAADKELAVKNDELVLKNSVVFECPCQHNSIRVFIDLSKDENTFTCPECKNTYRVDINMTPILRGRIVDEHNLYNLLQDKASKHE